jgi:hypothetical protein
MASRCTWVALLLLASPAARGAAAHARKVQAQTSVERKGQKWAGRFTYTLVSGQLFEWNTDPTAIPGLFREVAKRTGIEPTVKVGTIALDSSRLFLNPFTIMTGNRVFHLSDSEARNLRAYLLGGGFLYADDCGGSDFSFRRMLKQIAPKAALEELPSSHPLFKTLYRLDGVPKIVDLYHGPAKAYGLKLKGRLAVVYTYDTDIPCAWETYPDGSYVHAILAHKREAAFRLGINIVLFALSQHAPRPEPPRIARRDLPPATALPLTAVHVYRMERRLPCDHIRAIAAGQDAAWFGGWTYLPGEDEGLTRYDRKTGEFRLFRDAEGVLAEEINALALHRGKVLVGADTWKFSRGLSVFVPGQRRWNSYTRRDGLPHDRVLDIQVRGDDVWLACRSGLAVWDTRRKSFRAVDVPGGGSRNFMISILATPHAVWVNNFEHVWRHDPEQKTWTKAEALTPLLRGSAASLACDEGHVYIAPRTPVGAPVVAYDERQKRFEALATAADLGIEAATAIATAGRDGHREIWVGTARGEVFGLCEGAGGQFQPGDVIRKRLGEGKVHRILAEGPDIFAAVHPFGGVWHYSRQSRQWQQFRTRAGIPSDHILSAAASRDTLFVGTLSDGPWLFRPLEEQPLRGQPTGGWHSLNYEMLRDGQPFVYLGHRAAIRTTTISDILVVGSVAWMATNHGLILHDPRRTPRGFEMLTGQLGPVARLAGSGSTIYCALPDGGVRAFDAARRQWRLRGWQCDGGTRALAASGSTLWVATERHLVTLTDTGTALKEQRRVPARASAILAERGNVWVAASNGIYRHSVDSAPSLETPVADVRDAQALDRHKEFLLAVDAQGLWLIHTSPEATAAEVRRYDLSSHTAGHAITSMVIIGKRLYLGTNGGGLVAVGLSALGLSPNPPDP